MRHGIAEHESDAPDDFSRDLTAKGRTRARQAARGLHRLVPELDFVASSPKVRARETARLVLETFGESAPPLTVWSELLGDDFGLWLEKLEALEAETVLLCGHEPILSRIVSRFLTGSPDAFELEFKKASVCALEVEFAPLETRLAWHLTPKLLRMMGK